MADPQDANRSTPDGTQSRRARLHWLREARDHDLAALAEVYHPRMRALYEEYSAKRDAIWARWEEQARELRAAA